MQPNDFIIIDEWLYSELLDLLKKKEESSRQTELDLPCFEPSWISDENMNKEELKDRGITIIDF